MTLILVEVDTAAPKPEKTFNKPVVRVGREAGECDIVFDKAEFPMVSRRHAEFRCENGTWVLADLNSTYGVFVNGERIGSRFRIGVGNKVQIGPDGPALVVIWFDADHQIGPAPEPAVPPKRTEFDASRAVVPSVAQPSAVVPSQETPPESWEMGPPPPTPARAAPPASPAPPAAVTRASLEFVGPNPRPTFAISTPSVWLGRDPACDVVIDGGAAVVSRRHAEIRADGAGHIIEDNRSFNGTLVNEHRITSATPLNHDDRIRLGVGGPVLRYSSAGRENPKAAATDGQPNIAGAEAAHLSKATAAEPGTGTMLLDRDSAAKYIPNGSTARPQLLFSVEFGARQHLTIGRGADNEIRLDNLQISNRHARLTRSPAGVTVEDLRSTNGVYVNGTRTTREQIGPQDAVQIGSFLISVDAAGTVNVFDTRSRTRLDVVNVTREVRDRRAGVLTLLDSVSLSISPNEFVGVLGPSGAGKSMLMEVMAGIRPATSGNVLVNDQDLHRHLDSLKQSIGYVPQDDIIHRELTVYRTLYYVAKMRLSRDVSSAEIRQIVDEVLDVTGLLERRNVRVSKLSGGQRKRVSIAVELITKPSVIFLDEPTSGLDPGAEERIMRLFRQIAESGRTVIMTTHAMENVRLFDKIVVLMSGKLVFYGKPDEALVYLNAANFRELFTRLEQPVVDAMKAGGDANRRQITEQAAETWKTKFRSTPQFKENIQKPLGELGSKVSSEKQKRKRLGIIGSVSQWITLSRRYMAVLLRDKMTLFILLAQAPIIALMTFFVTGAEQPRDFPFFVLALVAMWFGTSVSAREIIRELPVYKRERMVNLGLVPYLASKLFVVGIIVAVQCLLLFVPLKVMDLAGLMSMPGELLGIPQLWAMLLTAAVGVGVGLFISGLVRTPEMATSLVPLILIPQLLFSGLAGVPEGVSRAVSMTMPAAWSFDTMKRFSTLDTLEPEGAKEQGKTKGRGLYKYIEDENEKIVEKAKKDFEDYKRLNEGRSPGESAVQVPAEELTSMSVKKVPDDLSGYVTFLHPWMDEVLNQIVLMLMFGMLAIATLVVLRLKEN
ncbi:MAG: FHA domain-containing protein [Pyrinomonadaceae bacterium]